MDYALDVPFGFSNIHNANMPADMSHWYTNAQEEIFLNTPADAVYVRYEGEPAVNYVRIYAHVVDDNPRPASPVRITHEWLENGQLRNFSTNSTDNGSEYYIDVNGIADNVSIEMAVDSQYDSPQPPTPEQSLATITWPPEGYTIANNSVIYFSEGDTPFDEWRMTIGSNSNAQGLFDSGIKYTNLNPREQILDSIPANGQPVTLRFWQRNTGGQWATFDTTYATEGNTTAPPVGVVTITWPTAGNTITSESIIYFSPGSNTLDEWRITVGSDSSAQGLFDSGIKNLNTNPWQQALSSIPGTGAPAYLRFWQRSNGSDWVTFDVEYATDTSSPPPTPPTDGLASITWPPAESTLNNDSVIYFSPGEAAFDEWRITVGNNTNTEGVFDSGVKSLVGNPPEQLLSSIPGNGSTVTLRFWQRVAGGQWLTFDTTYNTEESAPPQEGLANISWPPAGYVLTGDSSTIYFNQGSVYFDEWRITVGTQPNSAQFYDSGVKSLLFDPWEETISPIPSTGNIYLRFWQRSNGGPWSTFDTVYNTVGGSS